MRKVGKRQRLDGAFDLLAGGLLRVAGVECSAYVAARMFSTPFIRILPFALFLALATAHASSVLKISANSTVRVAGEVEANYSTTHLFVDEVAGDSVPVTIFYDPGTTGVQSAEIFTNLNRRDKAALSYTDPDTGIVTEEGIKAPSGAGLAAGDDTHYYKVHTMALVSGGYLITLPAAKTGAYRLTARHHLTGEPAGTYHYYNDSDGGGKRDHALVVSPKAARDIQLYETNPLTITATGTLASQRGGFADLANGIGGGPRFSLQYVRDLGCNMLWFQPIHPNGIAGRQTDPATSQPYEVGSPYAVKNFFEVMPLMAKSFTPGGTPATNDTAAGRTQAMTDFQNFVSAADTAGVGVMLDAPFNHTSYDTELAALGQTYWGNGGSTAASEIRNVEGRFFSRTNAYDLRASSAGNIAIAPDRIAEFAFADTYDIYFGRYAALESGSTGGHLNEGDWFDATIGSESSAGGGNGHFDAITQKVWKFFAGYIDFWLTQTGYPANAVGASLNSTAGLDALRADFGQGLPPQCWEYIINRTRARKWNFVFMAESLDGGAVTFRSARHFDILNENIVFPLHAAQATNDFRNIYEARRNAYGQALVLLNSSSHDEDHYKDPFHALIRYAANSTIDGVPLIFPGQELGLSGTVVPPADTNSGDTGYNGYDRYEVNFDKPIPHFKKYNSLMPLWLKTQAGHPSYNYGLAQLAPVYSGVAQARKFSAALRSSNRYFLNLNDNTQHGQIFSVAKFESKNGSPNFSDVVLAFVNLDRNANPQTVGANKFNVNIDTDANGVNDFGIKPARQYNVKNIAAYLGTDATRRDVFLIPGGILGSDLLGQGLHVAMNKVPVTDAAWASAPYEAQYLKLYDVTPPPLAGVPGTPKAYAIGMQVTFSWTAAVDGEGGISGYHVIISTGANGSGTVIFDGLVAGTSKTVTAAFGQTIFCTVEAVNNAGIESAASSSAAGTLVLDPVADQDGDGQSNASEDFAGTNPLSAASVFRITQAARVDAGTVTVTWSSIAGVQYEVLATGDLAQPFTHLAGPITASATTTAYTDSAAGGSAKFYKVRVAP